MQYGLKNYAKSIGSLTIIRNLSILQNLEIDKVLGAFNKTMAPLREILERQDFFLRGHLAKTGEPLRES